MDTVVVLWIMGTAVTILTLVIGWLTKMLFDHRERIVAQETKMEYMERAILRIEEDMEIMPQKTADAVVCALNG